MTPSPSALRARLHGRLRREDGVVLVLVALMMVVILGCAALAIDVGSFYGAQKRAQAAADAAALAAVQDLPSNPTQAVTDAQAYVNRNDPGAHADIVTGYGGDPGKIKVGVSASSPAFFAQVWGITSESVGASAVAGANPAASHAAIFGYDSVCAGKGVDLEGNQPDVNGGIWSNGPITSNANGNGTIGPTSYGGPSGCSAAINGNSTFSSLTPSSTLMPFPVDYRKMADPCAQANLSTYGNTGLTVYKQPVFSWASKDSLPTSLTNDSIFCASSEIDLTAPEGINAVNDVFIAPKIVLTANNSTFHAPSAFPVIFWVTSNQEFDLAGEHESLTGNIFDPAGTVNVTANNSTDGQTGGMNGFIEANDVIVSGNHFTITGTGPAIGTSGYGLTQ